MWCVRACVHVAQLLHSTLYFLLRCTTSLSCSSRFGAPAFGETFPVPSALHIDTEPHRNQCALCTEQQQEALINARTHTQTHLTDTVLCHRSGTGGCVYAEALRARRPHPLVYREELHHRGESERQRRCAERCRRPARIDVVGLKLP